MPYIPSGDYRETKRTAIVGAAGGFIATGNARKTGKWGLRGAAVGGGMDIVRLRRRRRQETELEVVKAYQHGDQLYRKETRVSPWRATEALAGVTLVAAGGSRLKTVGGAIKMGRKLPGNKKLPFERAHSIRNQAQKGTNWLSPAMRRNPTVSGAVELVPRRLRPAAATVGGAAMIGHARPVKQEKYTPTSRRR